MLDVSADIAIARGIDTMATVIIELAEDGFDETALGNLAASFPVAAGRRIGLGSGGSRR